MSELKDLVIQVDRVVPTVSEVMAKLNDLGYEETPPGLTSAYNAYFIYTKDGVIYWSNANEGLGCKSVKVKDLLEM